MTETATQVLKEDIISRFLSDISYLSPRALIISIVLYSFFLKFIQLRYKGYWRLWSFKTKSRAFIGIFWQFVSLQRAIFLYTRETIGVSLFGSSLVTALANFSNFSGFWVISREKIGNFQLRIRRSGVLPESFVHLQEVHTGNLIDQDFLGMSAWCHLIGYDPRRARSKSINREFSQNLFGLNRRARNQLTWSAKKLERFPHSGGSSNSVVFSKSPLFVNLPLCRRGSCFILSLFPINLEIEFWRRETQYF